MLPADDDVTGAHHAHPCESKVLLVGDSTMLAIRRYGALGALHGFNVTYDAAPGRTGPHRPSLAGSLTATPDLDPGPLEHRSGPRPCRPDASASPTDQEEVSAGCRGSTVSFAGNVLEQDHPMRTMRTDERPS